MLVRVALGHDHPVVDGVPHVALRQEVHHAPLGVEGASPLRVTTR